MDVLSPGFAELNLNKKVRGSKKPNKFPVIPLTRRRVVSKYSELFDPVGIWEPIKLQVKLHASRLLELEWDVQLKSEDQKPWKQRLVEFVRVGELQAKRCPILADKESISGIRLICVSDAGQFAGGAAVYAGRRLIDGSWSCGLIASKSKLLKATVPRNELSAILLMTELGYVVKKAIGENVDDIIYVTDSMITLAWCHNTRKKLRSFIFSRVESARRLIEWTVENENIPLFHIDKELNIADLLTKPHQISIEDVSLGSVWQNGPEWMRRDTVSMPLTRYDQLVVDKSVEDKVDLEYFDEPFLLNAFLSMHYAETGSLLPRSAGRDVSTLLVDPISLVWLKSIHVMNNILEFILKLKHRTFHTVQEDTCILVNLKVQIEIEEKTQRTKKMYFISMKHKLSGVH